MTLDRADERPHSGEVVDEWVFAAWTPDGAVGLVSGHRLQRSRAWYWFAVAELGCPTLHLTEWEVSRRQDPFTVKAPEMWAEHHCVAPFDQWTIGNEGHASALDDPQEAFGRGRGIPTPMSSDLEWYAIGGVVGRETVAAASGRLVSGFEQVGVAHGIVELRDRPSIEFVEAPAHRWRRWGTDLEPLRLGEAIAHTGCQVGFAFPDGGIHDWVLTPSGWKARGHRGPIRSLESRR